MFPIIVIPIKYNNLLHFTVFKNSQTFLLVLCLIPEALYENVKYYCHVTDENIHVTDENIQVENTVIRPKSLNSHVIEVRIKTVSSDSMYSILNSS